MMRPTCWQGLLAAATLMLSPAVMAGSTAYVAAWDTLYRLDLSTARATKIGAGAGFNDIEGLAIAPDGTLYGAADGTAGSGSQMTDFFFRIDPQAGLGHLVGTLGGLSGRGTNGQLDYGLTFTCDGRLWMSSKTTGMLWQVDRATGSVTEVFDMQAPISDLAARGNKLWGVGVEWGVGSHDQQALYEIDPETHTVSRIGGLGLSEAFSSAGAAFDANGTLWATLDSQPPNVNLASRLARIDVATGRATVVGSISGVEENVSVRALAITPPTGCAGDPDPDGTPEDVAIVPGPTLPWLLGLAGMALWGGRRRLRRG